MYTSYCFELGGKLHINHWGSILSFDKTMQAMAKDDECMGPIGADGYMDMGDDATQCYTAFKISTSIR